MKRLDIIKVVTFVQGPSPKLSVVVIVFRDGLLDIVRELAFWKLLEPIDKDSRAGKSEIL